MHPTYPIAVFDLDLPLMLNGLHLYSAFIQSALQFLPLIHTFTHIHTHSHTFTHIHTHSHTFTHIHTPTAIGCHARYQPAHQEQLGVRRLAQGHFDTPRVGIEPATLQLPGDSSTSWATSPHLYFLKLASNAFVLIDFNLHILLTLVQTKYINCQNSCRLPNLITDISLSTISVPVKRHRLKYTREWRDTRGIRCEVRRSERSWT